MRRVLSVLLAAATALSALLAAGPVPATAGEAGRAPSAFAPHHARVPGGSRRHRRRHHHHHHHRRHHRHHRRHHGAPLRRHRKPARRHRGATRASVACANANLLPTPTDLARVRAATLCLINRERADRGERPLQVNGRLERAAQGHTEAMVAGDYFSHFGPSGEGPVTRMRAAGYIEGGKVGYEVGENIAWGTLDLATPSAIVEAWMQSPGHRANILDARYRDTAIGVLAALPRSYGKGERGAIYTQDFGVILGG